MRKKIKIIHSLIRSFKQAYRLLPCLLTASAVYVYISFTYTPLSSENIPLKQMLFRGNVNQRFIIDTSGCAIPNYAVDLHYNESKGEVWCDERAIAVEKSFENEIQFLIMYIRFRRYKLDKPYDCCYSFVSRSSKPGLEDTNVTYTQCQKFVNGARTRLIEEVVTVTCNWRDENRTVIYRDAYMLVNKKIMLKDFKRKNKKWNVLLLGMDTMSRKRVYDIMNKTTNYLNNNSWLDYRGYNKVGCNTYPNLMAFMTGLNQTMIYSELAKEKMAWNTFRNHGYRTAYGEDFLKCPDTFKKYGGFKTQPTDHYMRPLFLTGEQPDYHMLCTQKMSSGRQVLNYAFDFANTYKKDSFFGLFWINSYSHDLPQKPSQIDFYIKDFFKRLNEEGILKNTFVIFLSDHGLRFGKMRNQVASYYDDRLPMLFIWVPPSFKDMYPKKYTNAVINQHRLVTPYDLHATLMHILKLSNKTDDDSSPSENAYSVSIFEEHSMERTCADAYISEKWCACHELQETNKMAHDAKQSIHLIETLIKDRVRAIKTQNCTICSDVQVESVLRVHKFTSSGKRNYVIAMRMTPIDVVYEGLVTKTDSGNVYEILGEVEIIMSMNRNNTKKGWCTRPTINKLQCRCAPDPECPLENFIKAYNNTVNLPHTTHSLNQSILNNSNNIVFI